MKILLCILLAFLSPFTLVFLYALGKAFYLMIIGIDKTPEMQYKIAVQKRLNAIRKIRRRKKLFDFLDDGELPEPLRSRHYH